MYEEPEKKLTNNETRDEMEKSVKGVYMLFYINLSDKQYINLSSSNTSMLTITYSLYENSTPIIIITTRKVTVCVRFYRPVGNVTLSIV